MRLPTLLATAFSLLATLVAASPAWASPARSPQSDDLHALDGTTIEVSGASEGTYVIYRGAWQDGTFAYETEYVRTPGGSPEGLIRKEFRWTDDGLRVRVTLGSPPTFDSTAIYRHAEDIAMPAPAPAAIGDLAWLSGAWVGTRGTSGTTSIEERWGPPLGSSLLGVSRTVSRGAMSAFEYLRVVERDGGLVYELLPEGGLDVSIGYTRGGSPRHFLYGREGG